MVMDVRVTVTFGVSGDKWGYIVKASVLAKNSLLFDLVVSTLVCPLHTNHWAVCLRCERFPVCLLELKVVTCLKWNFSSSYLNLHYSDLPI